MNRQEVSAEIDEINNEMNSVDLKARTLLFNLLNQSTPEIIGKAIGSGIVIDNKMQLIGIVINPDYVDCDEYTYMKYEFIIEDDGGSRNSYSLANIEFADLLYICECFIDELNLE